MFPKVPIHAAYDRVCREFHVHMPEGVHPFGEKPKGDVNIDVVSGRGWVLGEQGLTTEGTQLASPTTRSQGYA
jgi:hypothetical protein